VYQASPNAGTGTAQNFTFRISDADGYQTVQQFDAIFDTAVGRTNSCAVEYWAPSRTFFLRSDDNTTWSQGTLGTSAVLQNSQCSISIPSSSSSGAGTSLDITIGVTFTAAYTGTKNLFVFVADQAGLSTPWTSVGTWTVGSTVTATPPPPPPPTSSGISVQMTPSSGSGMLSNFAISVTDSAGAGAIQQISLFIGDVLGGPNACYIDFNVATRKISLRNNSNTGWSSGTVLPGFTGLLQNNQCALYVSQTTVSQSGDTVTLRPYIAFKSRFKGVFPMYIFGSDSQGRSTGWQNPGSWNVR
jgi:hypothetical protein